MIPIFGLIIGILVGIFLPYSIPMKYSTYVAVGILAAIDSVIGGSVAVLQGRFSIRIFISGFVGNAVLAMLLAYVGDQMGIQLYLAAVFAFGNRLFMNFASLRRLLIDRYTKRAKKHGKKPKPDGEILNVD
ncbi:MAG: small basic family protein [Clostridiales bacterium]|nr:small basic family protein [Clostridiales bacterium]